MKKISFEEFHDLMECLLSDCPYDDRPQLKTYTFPLSEEHHRQLRDAYDNVYCANSGDYLFSQEYNKQASYWWESVHQKEKENALQEALDL